MITIKFYDIFITLQNQKQSYMFWLQIKKKCKLLSEYFVLKDLE